MNKVLDTCAIKTIEAQCTALNEIGYTIIKRKFNTNKLNHNMIVLLHPFGTKSYRFSDPDLSVIICQLAMLYTTTRKRIKTNDAVNKD